MKNERGVTLIVLVITIIVMIILAGATIGGVNIVSNSGNLNNMRADITILEDQVQMYYKKNYILPKTEREIEIDEITYYEIDISKLGNIALNNGRDYNKKDNLELNKTDVYLGNDNLEVYYLKGVKDNGIVYHTYREYDEDDEIDEAEDTSESDEVIEENI